MKSEKLAGDAALKGEAFQLLERRCRSRCSELVNRSSPR